MKYFQKASSNKFKAKKQEYDGKWYHSKGEAAYAQELDWLKKAGEIKSWERQLCVPLVVKGVKICNYYVDFKVITKHDTVQYHEYKGFETSEWQLKWKLFTALIDEIDPGAELIVIKHKSNYKPKFKK
jgi:hypothetical protein